MITLIKWPLHIVQFPRKLLRNDEMMVEYFLFRIGGVHDSSSSSPIFTLDRLSHVISQFWP
jgi:hypothetical protein